MTHFLESLELSVRSHNVLKNKGISNLTEFMSLQKSDLIGCRNFGARSWREIASLQEHFRKLATHSENLGSLEDKILLMLENEYVSTDEAIAVLARVILRFT